MKISDFVLSATPIISIGYVIINGLKINRTILNSKMLDPSHLLKLENILDNYHATVLSGTIAQMCFAFVLMAPGDIEESWEKKEQRKILSAICVLSATITMFFYYIIDPDRAAFKSAWLYKTGVKL
ncbi:MAG: hypothetical protein L0207_07110 [Chlamydiae bacterium]|nr:hypothetical protein [Chlamydiota bacterium]